MKKVIEYLNSTFGKNEDSWSHVLSNNNIEKFSEKPLGNTGDWNFA